MPPPTDTLTVLQRLEALRRKVNASAVDAQFKLWSINVLDALQHDITRGRFTGVSKIAVRELKLWIAEYAPEDTELKAAYAAFNTALQEAGLVKAKEQQVDAVRHFMLQRNAWLIYMTLIVVLYLLYVAKDYWGGA